MSFLNVAVGTDISTVIVDLGIVILLGFIVGRMFEMIRIPAVTGYLVAGLLLGPISGYMSVEYLNHFSVIGDVALGFIAFQVGNELWFGKLKKSGMKIVIITVIQAVLTTGIVAFATSFFVDLPVALMLGAVAAATAPAPIMMIIKKYRTKGVLTDTILPVVGLDDAVGVVMFGALMAISVGMIGSEASGESSLWHMLSEPLFEIVISILLGGLIGFISGKAIQHVSDNNERKTKPEIKDPNNDIVKISGESNIFNSYRSITYTFTLAALEKRHLDDPESYRKDDYNLELIIMKSGGKGDALMERTVSTRDSDVNPALKPDASEKSGTASDKKKSRSERRLAANNAGRNTNDFFVGFNTHSPGRFDMFMENVEIESIMAPSEKTNSTTAMKIKFDVIEPYSINGFIEAIHTAAVAAGFPSYQNAAFLLKLEFWGYPDDEDFPDPIKIFSNHINIIYKRINYIRRFFP